MDLTMVLQNDLNSGLMWCGLSGKKLGLLPPNESLTLPLHIITMAPGLQVRSLLCTVLQKMLLFSGAQMWLVENTGSSGQKK